MRSPHALLALLLAACAGPRGAAPPTAPPGTRAAAVEPGATVGAIETVETAPPTPAREPLPVSSGETLSLGRWLGCQVGSDGALRCWGRDRAPEQVGDARDYRSVSIGKHAACAIRAPGTLHCWGRSDAGLLGEPSLRQQETPRQVGEDADWAQVSVEEAHACGVKQSGALYCWGKEAWFARSDNPRPVPPRPVGSRSTWVAVSVRSRGTCALDRDGGIACWGSDHHGRLAPFATEPGGEPAPLPPGHPGWRAVTLRGGSACALRQDGTLWCWGGGIEGEANSVRHPVPHQLTARDDWVALGGQGHHACALRADHRLHCWGYTASRPFGRVREPSNGRVLEQPLPVGYMHDVARFAAGPRSTCVATTDGALRCFGEPVEPLGDAGMVIEPDSFEPFTDDERSRGHLEGGMPDAGAMEALAAAVHEAVTARGGSEGLGRVLLRDGGADLFAYVGEGQFAYLSCNQVDIALRRTLGLDLQLAVTGADLWPATANVAAHFPESSAYRGVVVNAAQGLSARLPRALGKLGTVQEVEAGEPGVRLFAMAGPLAVVLLGEDHAVAGTPDALARFLPVQARARLRPARAPGCGMRRAAAFHRYAPLRLELSTHPDPAGDPERYRLHVLAELASEEAARELEQHAKANTGTHPLLELFRQAQGKPATITNASLIQTALGLHDLENVRRRGAVLTFEQNAEVHSGSTWPFLVAGFALDGGADPEALMRELMRRPH